MVSSKNVKVSQKRCLRTLVESFTALFRVNRLYLTSRLCRPPGLRAVESPAGKFFLTITEKVN